jgi:hypothetical protein
MPTATDEKLATDLTEFRIAVEKRFGSVDKALAESERDLKFIRWIGVFFAAILVALVAGSINVAWNAATIVSEVKQQREEMKELKSEVKQMAGQIDTIVRQTAPKAGG